MNYVSYTSFLFLCGILFVLSPVWLIVSLFNRRSRACTNVQENWPSNKDQIIQRNNKNISWKVVNFLSNLKSTRDSRDSFEYYLGGSWAGANCCFIILLPFYWTLRDCWSRLKIPPGFCQVRRHLVFLGICFGSLLDMNQDEFEIRGFCWLFY